MEMYLGTDKDCEDFQKRAKSIMLKYNHTDHKD